MITSEGIEKFSWKYLLLKKYVDFCFRRFYKISYRGREKVNLNDILIFASNHQNALMDALALLNIYNFQPVFLARSDIFKNKIISRILTFLKMLPVYRLRDGYGEVQKNDVTFDKTIEIFYNRRGLGIFPEGSHGLKKQLRQLKKGIARISLQSLHKTNNELDIKIVPIGMYYQDHHRRGSALHIEIGEPYCIGEFYKGYEKNPAVVHNLLLADLREKLKKVMLHVETDEAYETIEMLIFLYDSVGRAKNKNGEDIYDIHKSLIKQSEELFTSKPSKFMLLEEASLSLKSTLENIKLNLSDAGLAYKSDNRTFLVFRAILMVATFPLFLFSVLQNLIPSLFTTYLRKLPKEDQFISSLGFVGSIFIYPIIYFLQSLTLLLITNSFFWSLIYLISLPLALFIKNLWKDQYDELRKTLRLHKHARTIQNLMENIMNITGIRYQ